ncbi:MAG: carotenoid oxygenase family protein [Acidimicrobiales bacterium]|nr:carotenoid oxygenase family protein [Acidimicrobiales bacterium]
MTTTEPLLGHVTNAADHHDLRGNMFPVSHEIGPVECEVIGELPAALRGSFVRNGPNQMFEPIGAHHIFDGDGMLHGVELAAGKATYRNRWIHSRGLDAEIALGRAVYPGLSELMNFPDEALVGDAGPIKNRANTHIIRHAGKMLALWEQGLPTEVTADLETVGEWDFAGRLQGAMTAHPKLDPRTGEMFFFSYNLFPPFLTYYVVDAGGALVHRVDLDLPAPIMMHDFVITEDHAVFMDSPVTFNMEGVATGESMVKWAPENGTRLGVIPRLGTAEDIRWFEVEPSHIQHFWNAWVEGNRIELSGCRFPEVDFGFKPPNADDDGGIETIGAPPARYWIDLDAGTAGWEPIDRDTIGEMCRVNDDRTGVRTDCLYMSAFTREGAIGGDFDSIVKYDTAKDTRSSWYAGDTGHVGENVFAPDPDGSAEDDGWIINSMHDDADGGQSSIVVLDARDIEAGPVAQVLIPQRMPFGFHANWFPAG